MSQTLRNELAQLRMQTSAILRDTNLSCLLTADHVRDSRIAIEQALGLLNRTASIRRTPFDRGAE